MTKQSAKSDYEEQTSDDPAIAPRVADELGALGQCTAPEAIFAQWYAETRNLAQAYKQAYVTPDNTPMGNLYRAAWSVYNRPQVKARITELVEQMSANAVIRATQILQDLVDIADTDPNELVKVERFNCRHCSGIDFKFQWRDAMEQARAIDTYRAELKTFDEWEGRKRPPRPIVPADASGGYGFNATGDPHPACPQCYGRGHEVATIMDTTKLSPKARKLYAGVEIKGNGDMKILMHDQMKARDMMIKMLGAYRQDEHGKMVGAGVGAPKPIAPDATAEQAQREYLKLIE